MSTSSKDYNDSRAPLPSADSIAGMLARMGRKGVKLWSTNGQLRFRAAKGALTDQEIEILRSHKTQIVAMLETTDLEKLADSSTSSHQCPGRARLSFTQEAHWHRYKLGSQHAVRDIASLIRILGCVNVRLLRKSIEEIARRHAGLRTRIVMYEGIPAQEISESIDVDFDVHDLTRLPPHIQETELKRAIGNLVLEPIDVSIGPLWGIRLIKIHGEEHILIIAMEHVISDSRSLQILGHEILSAYMQMSQGSSVSLPQIPVQFAEYAEWQRNAHDTRGAGGCYLANRLSGCSRMKFPHDIDHPTEFHGGWGRVPIKFDLELKERLGVWSRSRQTTCSMAALTAYIALVSRWCNTSDLVVNYLIDGRTSDKIQNAIGFFAKKLPIRVEMHETDSFGALLKRITAEYCKAYEQADVYEMDAQVPVPSFSLNTYFNWISQKPNGRSAEEGAIEETIKCLPVPFECPLRENIEVDGEPFILLFDTAAELSGSVFFPKDRFSHRGMKRFASNFQNFIGALLEYPDRSVMDVALQ